MPVSMFLGGMAVQAQETNTPPNQVKAVWSEQKLALDNGIISLDYRKDKGTFTASREQKIFVREGRLNVEKGKADLLEVGGLLGAGKAIVINYDSQRTDYLGLYPDVPFIIISSKLSNSGRETRTVEKLELLSATLELPQPAHQMRTLGHDGLVEAGKEKTTYCWLAVADPQTRGGVVMGWLTHELGSGIVSTQGAGNEVEVGARTEYGRLRMAGGQKVEGETLAIGYFPDALEGLESYAAATAKINHIKLTRKVPCGYCTWYCDPHGGAADEKHLAELANFCQQQNLKDFGFQVIQIDDKWQNGPERNGPRGDYTTHRPDGPYPGGMKAVAEQVAQCGFTPGLWFIPFAWDHKAEVLKDHQDWFVHHEDGSVYEVYWAGTCLDTSHPQARAFLAETVSRITKDWGFKYIKIDGLWSGMATEIRYPCLPYGPDDLGGAVFHDPNKTNIEVYRDGLKLVRQAAGDEVFILGCNIAQNLRTLGASIGLVDGMRVGLDVGAQGDQIRRCAQAASRQYFWHNKVWYNDPDCLILREPLTLDQARAWASLIAVSSQMNLVSEWLPGLPAERLDILKRTIPNHGLVGRPVDLFEQETPEVWQLTVGAGPERQDIVCLINWDADNPKTVTLDLAKLKLSLSEKFVGFDYWENRLLEPFQGRCDIELRPGSCRVLALAQLPERPRLISTSRHVTQGLVEVVKQSWNEQNHTLSGASRLVRDDPYEVRIYMPGGFKVESFSVSDADREAKVASESEASEEGLLRVKLISPQTREVSWKLAFSQTN